MGRAPLPAAFQRLFVATCASNLGDGLRVTALPLLAATITRDPLAIGAISAATMGPWLLGPVGGTLVDRGDRARLMVVGQLARGLAVVALAAAVLTGLLQLWMIYVVAVIVGFGEVIVDSAAQAVIPALVRSDQLERANGRMIAGMTITGDVVGGPLGGVLFTLGAAVPLVADAASFLVGALLLITLHVPARASAGAFQRPGPDGELMTGAPDPTSFWHDVMEGLHALWGDRLLRPLAILVGLVNVGLTASVSILVLLALNELGLSEAGYGVLLGVAAVGGLAGSLMAEWLRVLLGRPVTLIATSVVVAAGMATLAGATTAPVAALGLGVVTMAGGMFNVVGRSLRQAVIPPELLGRVIASFRVIGIGGVPVGAFLGGWLARETSVRTTMTASAGLLALVAVGMMFTVRRIPPQHR